MGIISLAWMECYKMWPVPAIKNINFLALRCK